MIDLNRATSFALESTEKGENGVGCSEAVGTLATLGRATFEIQSGGIGGWLANCASVDDVVETKVALERIGDTMASSALEEVLGQLPVGGLPGEPDELYRVVVALEERHRVRWLEIERMLPSSRFNELLQAYVGRHASEFGAL